MKKGSVETERNGISVRERWREIEETKKFEKRRAM